MTQVTDHSKIYFLDGFDGLKGTESYQTIIVKSGDSKLFEFVLDKLGDIEERVIFVKNIETTLTLELIKKMAHRKNIILSGDFDLGTFSKELADIHFATRIFFNKPKNLSVSGVPNLEKRVGFMDGNQVGLVTLRITS